MKISKRTLATFAVAAGMSMVLPVAVSARRSGTLPEDNGQHAGVEVEVEHGVTTTKPHGGSTNSQGAANASATGVANASDNSVLGTSTDDNSASDDSNTATTPPADSITQEEAVNIAKAQMPSATVKKVEKELEHGQEVFSVRFTDGSRVDVAADGTIVRKEAAKKKTTASSSSSSRTSNSGRGNAHNDDNDSDDDHSGRGRN